MTRIALAAAALLSLSQAASALDLGHAGPVHQDGYLTITMTNTIVDHPQQPPRPVRPAPSPLSR